MKNGKFLSRYNLGLIISLSCTLVALEWKSYSDIIPGCSFPTEEIHRVEDDMMELLYRIPDKPEPKKEVKKDPKKLSNEINVVPDKTVVVVDAGKTSVDIDVDFDSLFIEPDPIVEVPIRVADVAPQFVGGDKVMYDYLYKRIKYSEKCREIGAEGTVYIEFVVDKKGEIIDAKIIRGIKYCKELEDQVLKVVENMPTWIPGKQKGHPVSCYFTLPVKFELRP